MNKNYSNGGLGKVFRFTFMQLIKNKANLISFGIFILVAALAIPVLSFFVDEPVVETGLSFTNQVMTMEDYLARDEIGFDARYVVQYGYSIVVMMICIFSGVTSSGKSRITSLYPEIIVSGVRKS